MNKVKLRNGQIAYVTGKSSLGRLLVGEDQEGKLLIWHPEMKSYRWDFDEGKFHDLDIIEEF